MNVKGKRALITGASAGIGKETAKLFASKGCNLLLLARDAERLQELQASLHTEYGIDADILPQDVSEPKQLLDRLEAYQKTRQIDIAIANAAQGQYGRVANTSWDEMEPILRINIDGAIATARGVVQQMIQRGSGSIIFVSSILGKRSMQNNAVYCATKFALHGFADGLRLEVKKSGVHVGMVCPSRTATEIRERMIYSERPVNPPMQVTDPPEVAAKAILRCVERRCRENIVSLPGKAFAYVGYHFPRISDFLLSRSVPEPQEQE